MEQYSQKLRGLLEIRNAGLPVVPFAIIDKNYDIEKQVKSFLIENQLSTFMVRTDSPENLFSSPVIQNASIEDVNKMKKFASDYTVFIMHPANTSRNLHYFNLLKDGSCYWLEALGPGFIARDMNKYGMVHEEIKLDSDFSVKGRSILTDNKKYQIDKSKKLEIENRKPIKGDYLSKYKDYLPVSDEELAGIKHLLQKIEKVVKKLDYDKYVISFSYLNLHNDTHQFAFWDIYKVK